MKKPLLLLTASLLTFAGVSQAKSPETPYLCHYGVERFDISETEFLIRKQKPPGFNPHYVLMPEDRVLETSFGVDTTVFTTHSTIGEEIQIAIATEPFAIENHPLYKGVYRIGINGAVFKETELRCLYKPLRRYVFPQGNYFATHLAEKAEKLCEGPAKPAGSVIIEGAIARQAFECK
jgi:hypothetical protein